MSVGKIVMTMALATLSLSGFAWTRHYSFRNGYPANVNRSTESNAVLKAPKVDMTTRMIVITNKTVKGVRSRSVLGKGERVDGVGEWAMGVALDGDRLFVITINELVALDVANPLEPKVLGSVKGLCNGRQIVVRDGYAYVVSRETGMRTFDVRDPMNMKLCSRYDSVEFATGIDVVGKTAFLSERIYGVEAVDVSDPYQPVHIRICKTEESQSNRYRNGYLYSGEWGVGKVTVFDAHDLKEMRAIGKLDLGGYGDGVELDGDYLYCSTGHDAKGKSGEVEVGEGHGLDIFSIKEPSKPKHVGRVNFPKFTYRNEDYWTPRVANGLAFCCDTHNGLFVVDVKDPTKPRIVGRFCVEEEGKAWPSAAIASVAIGKGCVYVAARPSGLWVIPVEGIEPAARPQGKHPLNPHHRAQYPTNGSKFHVYRPEKAGQARTVCLKGDVAYVAFGDAGLHVVRLEETGFKKLGGLPGNKRVTDCCFVGDRLLVAEGLDGWAMYELEEPTKFREVARRDARGSVAFWCWNIDDRSVVLSVRNGPYRVMAVDELANGEELCQFMGTCQWDKYLPERAIGGRLPVLVPYNGLTWLEAGEKEPKVVSRENDRSKRCGTQANGICNFGSDKFLYTTTGAYSFVTPDGKRTEWREFPKAKAVGMLNAIPRSDGKLVVCTGRSTRKASVWDFEDEASPKLLRAYNLAGNPDVAALWHGRAVIPAGHQGLIMEKEGK